jgi:hypothetical protein
MKIKLLLSGIFFLMISYAFSQTNLNDYKYIIVPDKFDFLKEKNQYQINGLAHFLFGKYGFNAIKEGGDYPEDLRRNGCLALKSDVLKEQGMFKTKLKVELKDCNGRVVYVAPIGESSEKEFKNAYNFALRNAFENLKDLNYSYKPNESITSLTIKPVATNTSQTVAKNEVSKEIQELKAEIENLKKEKTKEEKEVLVVTPKQKTVLEIPLQKNIEPANPIKEKVTSNVLYAQPVSNGFQLVDSSPKVVYKIKKTGLDDVFLIEGKSALIYKKDDDWVIEYYANDSLKTDVLNIKF